MAGKRVAAKQTLRKSRGDISVYSIAIVCMLVYCMCVMYVLSLSRLLPLLAAAAFALLGVTNLD